jgi:3-hydroxymyristoyl/3-hydroxydecanoyl-(acyl carrier protein) dehydratases
LRRHKLLDVIGDLALIGKPIKGRIIATRPGHTINNKFARQMRKEIRLHEIQAPTYDCNREPIMDVNRIRELLPHRYPMQLVDKVIEIGANYIVGVKNVTSNEPFFQGHFPQEPVMPGVLQIEAMAQTGGLLVLNSVDEPERYSTYFMKIDGVKFRQKVVPGDTLIFRVELMAPIRRGISNHERLCVCRRKSCLRRKVYGANSSEQLIKFTIRLFTIYDSKLFVRIITFGYHRIYSKSQVYSIVNRS